MSRLRLVTGRAGSGKTAFMLDEIRERMAAGETGLILLVPDQFSYEAERLLCETCGDGVSLHAEVLSFKRLFHRLVSDMGGIDRDYIDRAGKLLVMRRAVALADEIRGVKAAGQRLTDRILSLLDTAADCRSSRIQPERLYALSNRTDGLLRDKLRYLASVMEIYSGLLRQDPHHPVPGRRLSHHLGRGRPLLHRLFCHRDPEEAENDSVKICTALYRAEREALHMEPLSAHLFFRDGKQTQKMV